PLFPASSAFQVEGTSFPTGDTMPSPVTTTRRSTCRLPLRPGSAALAVLLHVRDRVSDGPHLLGVLVGDVDPELLLERHHELDGVEGVGAQVLDERRLVRDLLGLHS